MEMKINEMIKPVKRTERVIQFGEGGFLRGFVDWFLQKVNDASDFDGNVVVVQPIERGMCDMLEDQDCLYTHVIRGVEGVEKTVVNVISRCVNPYADFEAYLKLAENPDFRFIVSNTTESGISYREGDLPTDMPPVSFPAKVAVLMKKRFDLGLNGFIFLPCELIDKNGAKLKEIVLKYASEWGYGADFAKWVEEENIFCNTLVDRINTGYPRGEDMGLGYVDNLVNTSEYFHLWVIEGPKAILNEVPFDKVGLNIIVCDNLQMYRTRKVRILNGAHTSLVPYALLSGLETVKDCLDDEVMSTHLKKCIFDEIIPTLDLPKEELIDYANSVVTRFANPYIKHYLTSIALNSVSKFKVRVLPSILEYIKRYNKMPDTLIFSLACLIRFYKEKTELVNDDAEVSAFMRDKSVDEILANTAFWDTDLTFIASEVKKYL